MNIADTLKTLADKYETKDFLNGDPSWFMHQVEGDKNKEIMAFIAASLSYGSRKQFLPKIQFILDSCNGNIYDWVYSGDFKNIFPDSNQCFYRLYSYATMRQMLTALQEMLLQFGTIKDFVGSGTCHDALEKITTWFATKGVEGIIPKNTQSSCKRLCMFLRWMVRDNSPVDLGLWSDTIDRRTLIIPMDTHVLQEACRLGLLQSKTASMSSAIRLTNKLKDVFHDDPLKGDFALFGVGVNG